ncbi:hypothetical protein [Tahibacter amnicola]|uniref:Lysylphosphatidylglycerol synthase-like protein n=1 Tax=Tahibacter amnicola TaxID=2976241 RepID=A0ABY6BCD5_9GAMM|nr:hypothetical protein [Tahibacter amnicola]UXI67698.1 hypothetical protein N4264_23655 [Tahibacter amnicola]
MDHSLIDRIKQHGPVILARAQRLFLLTALVVIAVYLYRHRVALGALLTPTTVGIGVLASVGFALIHVVVGLSLFRLHRALGLQMPLVDSLAVYMRRIPARFIPGGIWHTAARFADLTVQGNAQLQDVRKLFVAEVLLVATAGMCACLFGALLLPAGSLAHRAALAMGVAGVGSAVLLLGRLARPQRQQVLLAGCGYVLVWSSAAVIFQWCGEAVAVLGTARACGPGDLGAVYLISAVLGNLAVFAPQGWGVAEASFNLINCRDMPLHAVLAVFLLFRLSSMAGDLMGYGVWMALRHRLAHRPPTA